MNTAEVINLISLPVVGALIGWGTNYLAIRMLFRPVRPVRIWRWSFQGVFPQRQALLAEKIGELVAGELLSSDDIRAALKAGVQTDEVAALLGAKLSELLRERVRRILPPAAVLVGPGVAVAVREVLRSDLGNVFEHVADELKSDVGKRLDVRGIVERKVASFPPDKLESLILEVMRRELGFVEAAGGFLGFLVGLLQAGIVLLQQ